jgi:hypothetical protein
MFCTVKFCTSAALDRNSCYINYMQANYKVNYVARTFGK